MLITKGLLVKGLAGLASVLGAGGIAVVCCKDKIWPNFAINTKITALGLPEDCKFTEVDTANSKNCNLNQDQLKKIQFKNIEGESITVTGLDNSQTITLEIKKFNTPTDEDKKRYKTDLSSDDLWFTFKTESITTDITIKKGENDTENQIKLVKGTNPEFKINNRKLEKAWSADSLAKKAGLKECKSDGGKKCTINTTGLKFSDDNGTTIKDLTLTAEDAEKITYTEDQQDYNQGFKFTVSTAVSGTGTNNVSLANGDYEVKYDTTKGWYLSKKTT